MMNENNYLILLLVCWLTQSCRDDRSKSKLDHTTALCNHQLYVEVFKIFDSGAFGGDKVTDYLTDSTNFRIYIGTYDNADEFYSFECNGDSVYVYKGKQQSPKNIILSKKTYSILKLKKDRKFD